MKDIEKVLRDIQLKNNRQSGVDIYVVIDDHDRDDPPAVARRSLTNEQLAGWRQRNE